MLLICTALYAEARPLIDYYSLKKNTAITKFQVFQNGEIKLVITNTGSIAAAVAVSYLCTLYPPGASDFLINLGICGSGSKRNAVGSLFFINKITEEITNRSFYPDVLFRHPFKENNLITCNRIIRDTDFCMTEEQTDFNLFDMEASGIYQAASYFYQPHQVSFLKIVSDYGIKDNPTSGKITGLIEKNTKDVIEWLHILTNIKGGKIPEGEIFNPQEESYIKEMAKQLHCTASMEIQLKQLLHYYKLEHGGFKELLDELRSGKAMPCKSKPEGKRYLEQLKERCM